MLRTYTDGPCVPYDARHTGHGSAGGAEEIFPAAARALAAAELEAVGREMAARRNVPFAPPAGVVDGEKSASPLKS